MKKIISAEAADHNQFVYISCFLVTASRTGGPHDPLSAVEMTRLALLKMYGGQVPPVSLPNLPPLPGIPADILAQAQQQQEKALNLHLQREKELESKDSRLRYVLKKYHRPIVNPWHNHTSRGKYTIPQGEVNYD